MSQVQSLLTDTEDEERSWRRFIPLGAGLLALLILGILLYRLVSDDSTVRKTVSQVVQVKLVPPPPPPPPPKEPEPVKEKPLLKPEPVEEPVPLERPPPLAAPSAPGPPGPPGPPGIAGLPGGGAPGGIAGGGGGGGGHGGGDPFASYAALLRSRVLTAVQRQPALRRTRYRVDVQIWLSPEGAPQRVELLNSLGSADLDKQLRQTLLAMERLPYAPPPEMPQPIVLQVNSL